MRHHILKNVRGIYQAGTVGALHGSVFFLFLHFSKALVHLNLGVAYATWSGVGLVVTAIISAVLFGQRLSLVGMIAIALIVVGCVLLNLFGTAQ